ncbi:MAG TPA: metallophosphoesterase [Myxococcales bacterium]|nr:metallophosphoesterase [Myxococcales bacterium]HBU48335.1 metallophosphoesterase [Myxococcales bacterium]
MKVALVSDLHANHQAAKVVFDRITEMDVDRTICLGDVVGYGSSPNEVCQLVRAHCDLTIVGNHDAAVAGLMDYSYYYQAARDALDWTVSVMDDEHIAWLRTLPYTAKAGSACFSHGSPVYPESFEYVFNQALARAHCAFHDRLQDVTFMGHTHLTRSWRFDQTTAEDVPPGPIEFESGWKYLVTVGSVGQPRDYDPRACFVIYDTERNEAKYIRVPYDIDSAAAGIRAAGLSEHFARRLYRGV